MTTLLGFPSEEHDPYAGKRFRDDVHLDIYLSPLEMKVVDHPDFQRLDGLRQLGTAYLLYRNAKHTRFEHAIGTVAATQQLIDLVNAKTRSDDERIHPDAQVIARMCALLHDIAYVPFGHSLEEEAKVIRTKHDSPDRLKSKIGEGTGLGNILGQELREEVIATLTATEEGLSRLRYPYIADVVSNTICADLLDYTQRDLRNTGLLSSFDPRFLSYLVLSKDKKGRKRLAIRLWRRKARGVRQEVITDIIALLRLRSMLAEKVYYHPNKMLTSAMVSRAVQSAAMKEEQLMRLTDEALLNDLVDKKRTKDELANKLARRLIDRKLYKAIYWVCKVDENEFDTRWVKQKQLAKDYHESTNSPENRAHAETKLEMMADLEPGSSIIYCPDLKMQLKPARVLVELPDELAQPLEEVTSRDIKDAVEQVQQQHKKLWRFYVFVENDNNKYWSDEMVTEKAEWINSACVELFAPWTDNSLFVAVGPTPYQRWAMKVCNEENALDRLPALLSSDTKLQDDSFWDDPRARIKAQLQALPPKEEPKKLL